MASRAPEPLVVADVWSFTVVTGSRPLTLNSERGKHWAPAAEAIAEWREAAGWAATHAGVHRLRLARARFDFRPVYQRGPMPDTGSIFPTEKAVIDALVDLDVIPDDNRWHNAGQLSLPPMAGRWTGVAVQIRACSALDGHSPGCSCRAARLASQAVNHQRSRRRR